MMMMPVGGRHGPGGVLRLPEEVQVVEDLHRFGVPGLARGRPRRSRARLGVRAAARPAAAAGGLTADSIEHRREV